MMDAETVVIGAVICMSFSLVMGRVLKETSLLQALTPERARRGSGVDLLRVGSAALVTLRRGLTTQEARAVGRRCSDMISDGVAHLVVEFEGVVRPTDALVRLLICLSELQKERGGRVCVVCTNDMVLEQLESTGVTDHVACLTPDGPALEKRSA